MYCLSLPSGDLDLQPVPKICDLKSLKVSWDPFFTKAPGKGKKTMNLVESAQFGREEEHGMSLGPIATSVWLTR